jgi:mannose-6-phosphate isomerase
VPSLYPLKFEPIFRSALWGGRRLATLFASAPADGPLAEAWVLSDQGDNLSRVANGPLAGATLRDLMRDRRRELLGVAADGHDEFPLLLKFIDARDRLSVQVHPDDEGAQQLAGAPRGKTEAWVVVRAEPGSQIYAGFRPGVSREQFEAALAACSTEELLYSFEPKVGDCVFLPAGIVHAIGGGLMVFEVQQTSDITFRLHDWGRVDPKTGRPRELHVEQALACTDFASGPRRPAWPSLDHAGPVERERLVQCDYFRLYRYRGSRPFVHDGGGAGSVLVGLEGEITVHGGDRQESLRPGEVLLLPATLGRVECVPVGPYTMLECVPV